MLRMCVSQEHDSVPVQHALTTSHSSPHTISTSEVYCNTAHGNGPFHHKLESVDFYSIQCMAHSVLQAET